LAAKLAKQKIVISERIAFSFYNSKILNFLRKNIYPLSDYLVVQTFDDKKNYSYIKNIDVIHNPLCINDAKAPKEKIILGVGRLEKQKGFDVLIKAFSKTPNTKWKLYIAGDGQEKKSLIDLIQDYGLTNVELIGKRKDIFDWYAKASIFVLSSQQEGFPNALLEAMAFGCASISFDCPSGPNEIINDNKNGLLIENQHHEKLAQAIQMLMENEEIRSKIGQEAMYIKEKYSIKIIASEWEALLNKVVRK
jgi:GalNAc-alpha-(1->4)-GalNAc-alpha-(1->3)-diNAcBac-PP-undecaprenol alpha-1,4-N-acetyl-D-galactosaminyltransferase